MHTQTRPLKLFLILSALVIGACGSMNMDMPNPPTELKATELDKGAHLTWKDNSDNEASFMVERKVGAGSFTMLIVVPFDTTAHHDAPLTAGETYTYRVMAMPKSGEHSGDAKYSNEVKFKLAP